MSDSYRDQHQETIPTGQNRNAGRSNFRGGRGGNRDGGGFRIRLSENEMRSARALQEAFSLRSTVAVLGFALRTLGQMLEEGKLDEIVAEHRKASRNGVRQGERPQGQRGGRSDNQREGFTGESRPNPFARPPKPESKPTDNQESSAAGESDSDSSTNSELLENAEVDDNEQEAPNDSISKNEPINSETSKEVSAEKN